MSTQSQPQQGGNAILNIIMEILEPRDEIELIDVDGVAVRIRTAVSARKNIRAIRALEAMLARPEIAPIAGEVRAFFAGASASKASGSDVMAVIVRTLHGAPAALEVALDDIDTIIADAYGDRVPSPASDAYEITELFKLLVPFFSRPLRAFLSDAQRKGGANGSATTSAG